MKKLTFLLLLSSLLKIEAADIRIIGDQTNSDVYKRILNSNLLTHSRYSDGKFDLIEVKISEDSKMRYLVSYMKSSKNYQFEMSAVAVDKVTGGVSKVEPNVSVDRVNRLLRLKLLPLVLCPDPKADVVFATPCSDIATAVAGVESACQSATVAGLNCKTLIGAEATVQAYKSYLTNCPKLKAFGSIGHGNTSGIILWNHEVLDANWFNALPDNELKTVVNYFNSCQVHNAPLEPAIMSGAGARVFIGGNVNLGIGTSEEVFKCFWNSVLVSDNKMGESLSNCEHDHYPVIGAHGYSGFTGKFSIMIPIPHPIPDPIPVPR